MHITGRNSAGYRRQCLPLPFEHLSSVSGVDVSVLLAVDQFFSVFFVCVARFFLVDIRLALSISAINLMKMTCNVM